MIKNGYNKIKEAVVTALNKR